MMKFTFAQAREAVKLFAKADGSALDAATLNETTRDLYQWAEEHQVWSIEEFWQMMIVLDEEGRRIIEERASEPTIFDERLVDAIQRSKG